MDVCGAVVDWARPGIYQFASCFPSCCDKRMHVAYGRRVWAMSGLRGGWISTGLSRLSHSDREAVMRFAGRLWDLFIIRGQDGNGMARVEIRGAGACHEEISEFT